MLFKIVIFFPGFGPRIYFGKNIKTEPTSISFTKDGYIDDIKFYHEASKPGMFTRFSGMPYSVEELTSEQFEAIKHGDEEGKKIF